MRLRFRYPGVAPFAAEQRDLFFGRDEVIADLSRFIQSEQLTVLYGKSGLGKSSLINAGVVPLLSETEGYHAQSIRFSNWTPDQPLTPLDIVEATLRRATENIAMPAALAPLFADVESLASTDFCWLMLRQLQGNSAAPVLLIFDQFEELFTYPQGVGIFGRTLAALLNNATPRAFRGQLEAVGFTEPLRVKVLMSIRADRISMLNDLAPSLPSVLRNLYQLYPFTRSQAHDAIVLPAKAPNANGNIFASASFSYQTAALNAILDYLSDAKGYIEGAQLQLICRYCEQKYTGTEPLTAPISLVELGDLRAVSRSYYDDVIEECPPNRRMSVRTFVEDRLIDTENRRRITVHEASLGGLGIKDLLPQLENSHLVRREPASTGGYTYEISHDTLVEPILQAREERVAEDDRLAADLQQREEAARLAAETIKLAQYRRRNLMLIVVGGSLLLLALVGIGVGVWKGREAQLQKKNADIAQEAAKKATLNAMLANIQADKALLGAKKANDAVSLAEIEAERLRREAALAQTDAKMSKEDAYNAQLIADAAQKKAERARFFADSAQQEATKAQFAAITAQKNTSVFEEKATTAQSKASAAKRYADSIYNVALVAQAEAQRAKAELAAINNEVKVTLTFLDQKKRAADSLSDSIARIKARLMETYNQSPKKTVKPKPALPPKP